MASNGKEYVDTHSEQIHLDNVRALCRLCTGLAQSKKKVKSTIHYSKSWEKLIKKHFQIDVSKDGPHHKKSDKICQPCKNLIVNIEYGKLSEKHQPKIDFLKLQNNSFWQEFDPAHGLESCNVCSRRASLSKQGRHKTNKRGVAANYEHLHDNFYDIIAECPDQDFTNYEIVCLTERFQSYFTCAICMNILSPKCVKTQCRHTFCSGCLTKWFRQSESCPTCKEPTPKTSIKAVKEVDNTLYHQLMDLKIRCKLCNKENTLEIFLGHTCTPTDRYPVMASLLTQKNNVPPVQQTVTQPKSKIARKNKKKDKKIIKTIFESLNQPDDTTPTKDEEKLFTHIWKRKRAKAKSNIVAAKTGGKPLYIAHLPKPRIGSNSANTALIRSRDYIIRKTRLFMAGRSRSSYQQQLASEIKTLPKKKKFALGKMTGLAPYKEMTARMGLMMKAHADLSTTQSLRLKQCLKQLGVSYATEAQEREEKKSIIKGTKLTCELKNFEFRKPDAKDAVCGMVIRRKPSVKFDSLVAAVIDFLNRYEKLGFLSWRDGAIPQDEIWLKIGGDKGGNSTKLCFQILNMEKPNSIKNTHVFCQYYAGDSRPNLVITLGEFKEQLSQLDGYQWNGKTIKLVWCADCDFIYKTYGLGGAKAKHPCFRCLTTKENMQKPRLLQTMAGKRSLTNLKADYQKFKAAGCPIKKQSEYNNVIAEPIVDVEVTQICEPYLHIFTGIIKKHHGNLEEDCAKLCLLLAIEKVPQATISSGTMYDEYVQSLREKVALEIYLHTLTEEIEEAKDECSLADLARGNEEITRLENKHAEIQEKIKQIEAKNSLPLGADPISGCLDDLLKKHNIHREKYHGKSFVGNHANKYLKPRVFNDVFDGIIETVKKLTCNQSIITQTESLVSKYKQLFTLYSEVHCLVNHSNPIPYDDLEIIQSKVDSYMAFYRRSFPTKDIILKQHLLECHVADCLEKWRVGFGLLGEQGFETIHGRMNSIEKKFGGEKMDKASRARLIMERQLSKTAPEIIKLTPEGTRRRQLHFH